MPERQPSMLACFLLTGPKRHLPACCRGLRFRAIRVIRVSAWLSFSHRALAFEKKYLYILGREIEPTPDP